MAEFRIVNGKKYVFKQAFGTREKAMSFVPKYKADYEDAVYDYEPFLGHSIFTKRKSKKR